MILFPFFVDETGRLGGPSDFNLIRTSCLATLPAFFYVMFVETDPGRLLVIYAVSFFYFIFNSNSMSYSIDHILNRMTVLVLMWICFAQVGLSGYVAFMLAAVASLFISVLESATEALYQISKWKNSETTQTD